MKRALHYLLALVLASTIPAHLSAQDGQEDLDEAHRVQLRMRSPEDVDRVIELCESALKKGLDENRSDFARRLLVGALWKHSTQYTSPIFDRPRPDPRWRTFRTRAINDLEKLLSHDDTFSDAYLMLARLYSLPEGDRDAAMKSINRAIELFADDSRKRSQAFLRRRQLRETDDEQLEDLNAAVDADPTFALAWQTRAEFFRERGKFEEAVEDFEKLLENDATNVAVHQATAEALNNLERYDLAHEHLAKAIELAPQQAVNYLLRARVHQDQEKLDLAIKDLDQALELQPGSGIALLSRARLNYVLNDLPAARADIDRVLATIPNAPDAIYLRSMIAAAERRYRDAINDLQAILRLTPNDVELRLQLASFYIADERPNKAITLLTSIIEDDKGNWQALRTRADALLSVGKHAEAISDYNVALEVQPEDDGILNNLAWVLATSPMDEVRDGTRAIVLATKACEVTNYEKPHILSTLAAAYAEADDFENAIKWSTQAVEKGKTDLKDQLEQLQQELDSYKEGKAWRELLETKDKPDSPRRIFEA